MLRCDSYVSCIVEISLNYYFSPLKEGTNSQIGFVQNSVVVVRVSQKVTKIQYFDFKQGSDVEFHLIKNVTLENLLCFPLFYSYFRNQRFLGNGIITLKYSSLEVISFLPFYYSGFSLKIDSF